MRVLCVSTDYPPPCAGGYERQCAGFVEHLRRRGHEVDVLAGAGAPAGGDPHVQRVLPRFAVEPRPVAARRAWRDERRSAAVLGAALRAGPDAVCFWRLGELSMSLVERVRRAGIPAVGMVCDPWMVDGPRRDPWCARRGSPPRFAGAARWLFVSEALRRQVIAAGVELPDADVVPWGVELSALPLAPERPWRDRLLYAGRLSPLKGVDTAIRVVAHLPGATLDVLGAGRPDYERELRDLAATLAVRDRVRFHGLRAPGAVAAACAEADALLFPARWEEPFGAVPLEAMARGTPVVGTATGGTASYLAHERTGLVVAPDDPTAMAAAVRRLRADPALRRRLRAPGRLTAERYPAERSHERVAAALEEAARRSRASRRST
jgi:glycogen synthase